MDETARQTANAALLDSLPTLSVPQGWTVLVEGTGSPQLLALLPHYLLTRRWFGGKARAIKAVRLTGTLAVPTGAEHAYLCWLAVDYEEGEGQSYVLPLALATGEQAEQLLPAHGGAVLARVQQGGGTTGLLYDVLVEPAFARSLLAMIANGETLRSGDGELRATTTAAFHALLNGTTTALEPRIVSAEQSNTSVIYGDRLIMKLFRRLERGTNPDLEMGRFLTDYAHFTHIPPVAGALEYWPVTGEGMTVAILQGFVPNEGDAWSYTSHALEQYFRRAAAEQSTPATTASVSTSVMLAQARLPLPQEAVRVLDGFADSVALLGRRSGELHLALASAGDEPDFAPEPFSMDDQHAFHAASTAAASRAFVLLRAGLEHLPPAAAPAAARVLAAHERILSRFEPLLERPLTALRIRCHGDYHLGQVLWTGDDFFIIDFEGEPARPLSERRRKSSALQDVAGMLRSLHYAPYAALRTRVPEPEARIGNPTPADADARTWHRWASCAFLGGYLAATGGAAFVPSDPVELQTLLDVYLLDKAIYEMVYELNNRPDWITIPLEGILQLLEEAA